VPAYRDDREALLQRAEALERELARAREEAAALREENRGLRERAPAPPAPEPEPPAPPVPALARPGRLDQGAFLGTLAVWAVVAAFVGGTAWLVPIAVTTAVVAGLALRRNPAPRRRTPARALPAELPVDRRAHAELLATRRKTLNVQIDVRFAAPLAPTQRAEIEQALAAANLAARWDQDTLQLRSRRLRVARKTDEGLVRDPSPIAGYCEDAFAALARVHRDREIVSVTPRATRSRR
jgi:hypothetical protein